MQKILIIRFSSIGDIVLTTPVIRCVKQSYVKPEVHFLTKKQYLPLVEGNTYIDKIYTIEKSIKEVIHLLKKENYSHIIDLHKNLRTLGIKLALQKPNSTFKKLNFKKRILVDFKINILPKVHIVDRYIKAADFLNVENDGKGLDYFIPEKDEIDLTLLPENFRNGYITIALGSIHETKQIPIIKVIEIIKLTKLPVILLGGKQDKDKGDYITAKCETPVYNACSIYNLNQSASAIKQSKLLITGDTGLMHIASALKKDVISLWGNTVLSFGMYPYFPENMKDKSHISEVKELKCRPCSKLGFKQCPRNHFLCMNLINEEEIAEKTLEVFNK